MIPPPPIPNRPARIPVTVPPTRIAAASQAISAVGIANMQITRWWCTDHISSSLCHQPEPDDSEAMIERERKANSRALHDRKARRIDGRQLVQVRTSKVAPRLLQIAQLAGNDLHDTRLIDRFFPCQRHVPAGIPIEKRECADHDRARRMQLRTDSGPQPPLIAR